MAKLYHIHIWKEAPILRLLIPVVTGILLEFYAGIRLPILISCSITVLIALILFSFLSEAARYGYRAIQGVFIFIFLVALGSFITWQKDIRHHSDWYGKFYNPGDFIVATIQEPPVEKAKSYKALATVETVIKKETNENLKGKILIYFAKDPASQRLKYGDRIILDKSLQPIKNTGNPAAFNYAQYCAFQQIFQQVYLKKNEWVLLKGNKAALFQSSIFKSRNYILQTLDKYIPGEDESSLAKALLIGYRIDLDKDLVQAYSNAGVVHLIAISGLHLSYIYFFLLWVFSRLPFIKKSRLTRVILVLLCLWFFSLLTGAPASVLRSAVMFTAIGIGSLFNKKNLVYNSLAVSAFVLLCYDPFILWDVGFQLSYLAVLGIVAYQKYIYQWFYFKNKYSDYAWKVASCSIAAQLLTLPVCIYYFHQFPLLFLLSNMIAIPLSTIALWGCIAIVALSSIPFAGLYLGKIVWVVIWLLNHSVLAINSIPFSLWNGISVSITGAVLLYLIFISLIYWLIKKSKPALKLAITGTLILTGISTYKNWKSINQKKVIVYNIPMHKAIDFIQGTQYYFVGDPEVVENNLLVNYNIKPAHVALTLGQRPSFLPAFWEGENNFYQFYNCRILIVDSALAFVQPSEKIKIDYIIFSKNPELKLASFVKVFDCKEYIFDASNSLWKIEQWKKECEELHLQFHSVSEQGAFVINL